MTNRRLVTESNPGHLGNLRSLSTTDGGTALSTTKARILVPEGTSYLFFNLRDLTTAVVAQISLLPKLSIFKTTDDHVSFTDYSSQAQDGDAGTDVTLSSLGTAAQGDYVYVGAHRKFGGVAVDVDTANSNASVLVVEYWDGAQWQTLTATDGTDAAGATFGTDGSITWTVPAAWKTRSFERRNMYWVRFSVTAALDASTVQNSWWAINPYPTFELTETGTFEIAVKSGAYGIVAVEAETNSDTGILIVNASTGPGKEWP